MVTGRDFEVKREYYRDLQCESMSEWRRQALLAQPFLFRQRRDQMLRMVRSLTALFFL